MTAEMACDCRHLKSQHAGETYACRNCPCKRYTPDIQGASLERDLDELEATDPAEAERDELRSANIRNLGLIDRRNVELRLVTAERDRFVAAADKLQYEWLDLKAELYGVRTSLAEQAAMVEDLQASLAARTGQLRSSRASLDLAQAELASARTELEQLRSRLQNPTTQGDLPV